MHDWGKAEDALVYPQSENEIKFLVKNPVQNYPPLKKKSDQSAGDFTNNCIIDHFCCL